MTHLLLGEKIASVMRFLWKSNLCHCLRGRILLTSVVSNFAAQTPTVRCKHPNSQACIPNQIHQSLEDRGWETVALKRSDHIWESEVYMDPDLPRGCFKAPWHGDAWAGIFTHSPLLKETHRGLPCSKSTTAFFLCLFWPNTFHNFFIIF